MNCFRINRSKTSSPVREESSREIEFQQNKVVEHEVITKIKECNVQLIDEGHAFQLATGDFTVFRVSEDNVSLAITIKVGDELQWPLTKDEPVVKLDELHYLFSLPMANGAKPLSYGVTFSDKESRKLKFLDIFLTENSLFTRVNVSSSSSRKRDDHVKWEDFAPAIENYNNILAKAIAGGTGQIVKGMFECANAYSNQVQKGGETIFIRAVEERATLQRNNNSIAKKQKGSINTSLARVRKLSETTEKLSKSMLNAVGIVSGGIMAPVIRKTLSLTAPGQVSLASLDAVNKIIDAAEISQKMAMKATSTKVTRMVTERYGEEAGEATEDVLATAEHCVGTAWNVFKIRKALNSASSGGIVNKAAKY